VPKDSQAGDVYQVNLSVANLYFNSMLKKIIGEALTFDDVTLVPGISEVPAHDVDLKTRLTKKITLDIPLVSSAMDTVTGSSMAQKMAELGGIGIIHRNLSIEEQGKEVRLVHDKGMKVGAAIGTSGDYLERAEALVAAGADVLVIDLAHGSTVWGKAATSEIKKRFPDSQLIAGNIATADGAKYLASAGADAVKVGIGGGSICTTRIITGVGVPNITAIMDVYDALGGEIPIIIDGGVRYSGDMVKAIAAGADCGMCGSLLAGTEEAPGDVIEENGKKFKLYRGMSVKEAMTERTRDRYYLKKDKCAHTSQGVSGLVPFKGTAESIIQVFVGGMRAGMENIGAKNINELQNKGTFYRVSDAGSREAHPHNIQIMKNELNYSINR